MTIVQFAIKNKLKSTMESRNFTGQPIYAQITKYLSKGEILRLSRSVGGERYVKKFDGFQHLLVLLFAVFKNYRSLREILTGVNTEARHLWHAGFTGPLKMSTFSDANNRRPSKFFEAVYKSLYEKFGRFLPDSRDYEWAQKLYVMDSTTISLFSNVLKGAGRNPKIGRKNGGIKSHTIMKALTGVPEFIRHTAARVHDHVMLGMVKLPKDSFIAFDRAYIDYRVFEKFTRRRITYVTKMKRNLTYKVLEKCYEKGASDARVRRDDIIEFRKRLKNGKVLVHKSRLVEYVDPHTRKHWQLLTNNMELKDAEVIEIYKRRWQIESLYKQLKQNFPLHFFYGESANAIETQIWVVMIANLLVKLVKAQVNRVWSFSNLVSLLRHALGYYYDLVPFLENPERVAASSFVGGRSPPGQLQLNLV